MRTFQASVYKDGELYVSQCLEIDIASQGETQSEALDNLREAIELFFETASPGEIEMRVHEGVEVALLEAYLG